MTQKILPIMLLAGVLFLALLALYLQAQPPTAAAMVKKAGLDAKRLTSFEYSMTGAQTFDSGVVDAGRLVIQMEMPDKAYTREYDADDALLFETIQVGETVYDRSDGTGAWTSRAAPAMFPDDAPEAQFSELVDGVTEFLTDVEVVGDETLNGQSVRHLRGQTDMAAKANLLWPSWDDMPADQRDALADARRQFLDGAETVDYWIDAATNRLVQTTITATRPSVGDEEGYTAVVTIAFSRYNEALNITAPAEAQ